MSLDVVRAYFDERIIGKLSESNPLQSAVFSSVFFDDEESASYIESDILKLFQDNSLVNTSYWPDVDDARVMMSAIPNNTYERTEEPPHSIQDDIEFATAVIMTCDGASLSESDFCERRNQKETALSEVPTKRSASPPVVPIAPIIIPKKPTRTSGTQTDAPAVTNENTIPGAKPGSFQSGKDKFLQDVSTLARQWRKLVLSFFLSPLSHRAVLMLA